MIIPTYNRAPLIHEVIESVCRQAFSDYEIIVVDDGSTDGTEGALALFGDRIKVIKKRNEGSSEAKNSGAHAAKGEYLAFLDDDDVFFPWTLETYNRVIVETRFPKIVLGQPQHFMNDLGNLQYQRIDERIEYALYKDFLAKDRPIFKSCSMITVRKEVFRKVGGFRGRGREVDCILDDHDFLLRAGTCGLTAIVFEPKMFGYRSHGANSVKDLNRLLSGVSYLIDCEENNEFAGGKERMSDRYSVIGGAAFFWIKRCVLKGLLKQSARVLLRSLPMIFVGFLRKISSRLGEYGVRLLGILA